MLGAQNDTKYSEDFRVLSLLDRGLHSQPGVPLLLVNGKEHNQRQIADIHLFLDHGSPKSIRLFPGGHIGSDRYRGPRSVGTHLK